MDYNLTKIRAMAFDVDGVLSPSTVPMTPEGDPLRMVNVKDGFALQLAVKNGFKIAIITGGESESVAKRYKALGVKDVFQRVAKKLPVLEEWMEANGLHPDEVMYMGDDIPDLPCMRYVGLPCAPRDAVWELKDAARYVSRVEGGYGCVRDVVEQVLKANGCWLNTDRAFSW